MADYTVRVRNYHWSHQNTLVQSPVLDLTAPVRTLVVQPLEGTNKQEPRVLSNTIELRDDIQDDIYETEAHGVSVSTGPSATDKFPVWVPVHSYKCKEGEVYVVNLTTFEASKVPVARICWVPSFKAPDGKLYTVIGAPRKQLRETRVLALAQQVGFPREARFITIDPTLLASYDEISHDQKKALFDIQLIYIRTGSNPPSMLLSNGYRVFSSPNRFANDRLSLEEVLSEDLEAPRRNHSICSSRSSSDSSSDDDDESLYDEPTYVSLVVDPKRFYTCDCKYPGLRPTCFDPYPGHRHGTDEECSLGSTHTKHCVFADHAPDDCVITGSSEKHEHCIHLSEAIESDFKRDYGADCCADVEAFYEDTGKAMNDEFPMDLEPAFANSPTVAYLSESDFYAEWESIDLGELDDVDRLCLPGSTISTSTVEEPIPSSYMSLEHYGSPEPKDMEV
ncbi:uncharacterized protein GGS22DRAFT_26412 [Annulohypoxylon maeteangense]|uniref:uncharacterized protein n=1 Tax=Annulohypoxylon maeteangense TaxID=1927788 RepID=UPI0020079B56|nr:uncharacterized protein GGS22DRAFT_26412 [Annulohypoxylon maeteangense]KAI0883825.1 hypothetical protein GGS22DRAFT_26412 [Annulohypoxylon maeteangense]